MTVTMIANKRMTYATRMLNAGDRFEAKPGAARLFSKVGRAHVATASDPKPQMPKVPAHDGITIARAEYERVVGKRPHMGWSEDVLREKIAAARNARAAAPAGTLFKNN